MLYLVGKLFSKLQTTTY